MSSFVFNNQLKLLTEYSLLQNDKRKEWLKSQGKKVFDYGIGDPLEETPAFIREALLSAIPKTSQYPSAVGSMDLRKACAQWIQRRFNVSCDAQKHIISSNGSKESVYHIAHLLIDPHASKKIIAYPEPGYPVYRASAIMAGGEAYPLFLNAENNFIFDVKTIPKNITKNVCAIWIGYPHNPTGAVASAQELSKVYEWCLENNIVLLSDECYVDSYFPGTEKPVSLMEISQKNNFQNVLCFFSLSKRSGMTGYRSGFVSGDEKLIQLFAKYRPNVGVGTPSFIQAAAIAAWGDDAHAAERNAIFAQKRKIVEEFFVRHGFVYLGSNATFYMWAKTPEGYKNADDFVEAVALKTGGVMTPGSALGQGCEEWFRLALVPTAQEIREHLELWKTMF